MLLSNSGNVSLQEIDATELKLAALRLKDKTLEVKQENRMNLETQRKVLRVIEQLNTQINQLQSFEDKMEVAKTLQEITELLV